MGDEAEVGDEIDRRDGQETGEQAVEHAPTKEDQSEVHDHAEDEGDDLVLGQRGEQGADREVGTGHQGAAEVAGHDNAPVRVAEPADGEGERECQQQGETEKSPRGEKLAQHSVEGGQGQGEEQLDGAAPALLGPEAHAYGGDEEKVEPGVENEKALERGLVGLEEAADEEGEADRGDEEDDEEHVGHRGAEVAEELTFEDGGDLGHGGERGEGS